MSAAVALASGVIASATAMVGEDERRARIAWSMVTEPGRERPGLAPPAIQHRIAEQGPVQAWHALVEGTLGCGGAARQRVPEVDVDAELGRLRLLQARTVIPGDDEWPLDVDPLDAPHLLHVLGRGDLVAATQRSVAVVGSRASTGYGENVAAELGHGLAVRGWGVVSGAAYGIDAAAHRGALAGEGRCVVVLPCGPDRVYPAGHRDLVRAVIDAGGCVVTELATGAVARRHRFLSRNRLIAGLARATCVVEAGLRSGSLNTAAWSEHLMRPVAAVPGPVTSMSSAGCHDWIRTGRAELVCDAGELLALAAPIGEELGGVETPPGTAHPVDALGTRERRVHDALRVRQARTIEQIASDVLLEPGEVLDLLGGLEIDGWASRHSGGWCRRLSDGRGPDTLA